MNTTSRPRLNVRLISSLGNVIIMSAAEMMAAASIATTTWYAIMQKPEGITVQQLLAIANGLHIPVRRFFSFGRTDYIGRRADYIMEPYQPCRYDAAPRRAQHGNRLQRRQAWHHHVCVTPSWH